MAVFRQPKRSLGEAEASVYRQRHWQCWELPGLSAESPRQQQWVERELHPLCWKSSTSFSDFFFSVSVSDNVPTLHLHR